MNQTYKNRKYALNFLVDFYIYKINEISYKFGLLIFYIKLESLVVFPIKYF